jgi:hypothetical protein
VQPGGAAPRAIQTYAQQNGIEIELVGKLPSSGRVLELEISDAIESGNAWTGRQKGLVIQGRRVRTSTSEVEPNLAAEVGSAVRRARIGREPAARRFLRYALTPCDAKAPSGRRSGGC